MTRKMNNDLKVVSIGDSGEFQLEIRSSNRKNYALKEFMMFLILFTCLPVSGVKSCFRFYYSINFK